MTTSHPKFPLRRSIASRGMTLIELLIAMGVFALMAGGILSVLIQSRRIAELNIYASTAQTAARGYLEQIKAMPYASVYDPALPARPLPTLPVPITPNVWNTPPPIDINLTTANASDDIVFRIKPTIVDLSKDTTAPITGLQCYEIVIDYEFDSRFFGSTRTYRSNVRLIRSQVPAF